SRHGTRVNGQRLRGTRALGPGDAVFISNAILLLDGDAGPAGERPLEAALSRAAGGHLRIGPRDIVVADPALVQIFGLIRRLVDSDLPALIGGETGVGKEVAAAAFHYWSRRQAGPLVALNCAALPENLVESELFGHEKGAFSGAVGTKIGLLES